MILLLLDEWIGITHGKKPIEGFPKKRNVGMATSLPLGAALNHLKKYRRAYADKYHQIGTVVEFRLLSVSNLETITLEELASFDIEIIENLPTRMEDF